MELPSIEEIEASTPIMFGDRWAVGDGAPGATDGGWGEQVAEEWEALGMDAVLHTALEEMGMTGKVEAGMTKSDEASFAQWFTAHCEAPSPPASQSEPPATPPALLCKSVSAVEAALPSPEDAADLCWDGLTDYVLELEHKAQPISLALPATDKTLKQEVVVAVVKQEPLEVLNSAGGAKRAAEEELDDKPSPPKKKRNSPAPKLPRRPLLPKWAVRPRETRWSYAFTRARVAKIGRKKDQRHFRQDWAQWVLWKLLCDLPRLSLHHAQTALQAFEDFWHRFWPRKLGESLSLCGGGEAEAALEVGPTLVVERAADLPDPFTRANFAGHDHCRNSEQAKRRARSVGELQRLLKNTKDWAAPDRRPLLPHLRPYFLAFYEQCSVEAPAK